MTCHKESKSQCAQSRAVFSWLCNLGAVPMMMLSCCAWAESTGKPAGIVLEADRVMVERAVVQVPHKDHRTEIRRVLVRDGDYYHTTGERRRLTAEERETLRREMRQSIRDAYGSRPEHAVLRQSETPSN